MKKATFVFALAVLVGSAALLPAQQPESPPALPSLASVRWAGPAVSFDALRGKRWVLKPHAVQVERNAAKANLFAVPDGYVVPVTFGKAAKNARVALRQLEKRPGQKTFKASVIHPGSTEWKPLTLLEEDGVVTLDVPLMRGCAMVKIR